MDELLELINGSVGENVKYDDDYMEMQDEVEKLTSVSEIENVDFKKIKELSENILKYKSKDFFAAVYYSYALIKLDINNLEKAICFIADFTDKFYEDGYPKKEKAKINAIKWWLGKITYEIKNMNEIQRDDNPYFECIQRIEDKIKNSEYAPSFTDIKALLNQKVKKILKKEPEKKESEKQKQQAPSQNDTEEITQENAQEIFKKSLENLDRTLGFLTEIYKPEIFMLNRIVYMYDIDELPIANEGKTLIPPPSNDEINAIKKLYETNNYKDLLLTCESKIKTYVFWFDLHFYSYHALKNMNYEACANAVYYMVKVFIKKLPGIEKLSFKDGTPFASNETKNWLNPPVKEVPGEKNRYEVSGKNEKEKIEYLNNKILTSKDLKEKINWMILAIEHIKNNDIKDIYINDLFNLLKTSNIESFDTELAIKAYNVLLNFAESRSEISKSAIKVLARINLTQFI